LKLQLIFKENDMYASWKIDFWCSFFDPLNRGIISNDDFSHTCGFLAEQSKKTDEFLHEKIKIHVSEILKDYFVSNGFLNVIEMKKGIEKKHINLIHFVK